MNKIINDSDLSISDITKYKSKSRALLVTPKEEILIGNYGDVYLLPGGTIEMGEEPINTLKRELVEETGLSYSEEELLEFLYLEYYQRNFASRSGENLNRLLKVHYYIGPFDGFVDIKHQHFTESEKQSHLKLETVPLCYIRDKLKSNLTANPRRAFFDKEMMAVLDSYQILKDQNPEVAKLILKK